MGIAPQGLEVAALRRLGTSPGGEGSTELPGDLGIKAALLAQNGTGSGMLFVPRSSTWGQAEGRLYMAPQRRPHPCLPPSPLL